MNKSYCFIGMPYSGKSLLGFKVAHFKNKKFIDTDILLKNKYNNNISNIIKNNGYKNFILKEKEIIKSIKENNIILSPGGSVIYSDDSLKYIKNYLNCDIIHLHISYAEFCNRLVNLKKRGIINPNNLSLIELYNERTNLSIYYSDITFNANDKKILLNNLINYIE